jgi:hypothetical protein
MPGGLLLKARIYPISLVGIADKYEPSLEFSRKNYNTWKVEIAVGALSSLLEELWKTQKAVLLYNWRLPDRFQETGHDPYFIQTDWQELVPLALAVHLHGDFSSPVGEVEVDLGTSFKEKLKSAIEAVKSLNVSDATASKAIDEFLSLFRKWAENVAKDPSQRKSYNDILEEVNGGLSKVFPVEEVRKHIAAFASDLLRLVSVTEEELRTSFQDPINEFFSQLKGTYISFLQENVWVHMSPFDSIKDRDVKQFTFEFFPWILIVRYYLNKMTGNVRGSLWRELMEDPYKTLGAGAAWGSNLPALLWGSLYPSERQEKSPKNEKFAEEAISSPSAIAPRVTGATAVGTKKLPNMSLAAATANQIAILTTGLPLGLGTEEVHRRNYPGQLLGVVEYLRDVLNFVLSSLQRSQEQGQDPVATLKEIIENPGNSTLSSFLKTLLGIKSLDSVTAGQVETFIQILQDKVNRLDQLKKDYSHQQKLLAQAWVFFSEFGKIIGREVQFHDDVDKMISEIFRMFVEVSANYRSSEWRRALWPLASNAYRFFGSHLALSNGVPTNEFEATGALKGAAGTRPAILRFIDTVINTTSSLPQEGKDLFKRLVDAIKELYMVLRSKEVAVKKRGVLGISSSWLEDRLDEELGKIGLSLIEIVESNNIEALYEKAKESFTTEKLEEELREIGVSLEEIVTSGNIERRLEEAKEFLIQERLKGIFSWFRSIVEKSWQDLADKAAKRVSQVVKGLSLTTMPPVRLSEWLETLFRAARVERRTMVPIGEGFSPEEFEESEEKPVLLEAPARATIADIENFLYRVLEELASAHRGVENIVSILENFADAWDKYVAEVGRDHITIKSSEFRQIVGRVLEELLRKDRAYKNFVQDFVIWLYNKGGSIEELKRFPNLKGIVEKVLGGKTEKEEVRVEEPSGEVEEGPEPPFESEEGTSASPDLLEEEVSPGSPSDSSEPTEPGEEPEEEEEERHLLLKFVFLAKALRVFP